MRTPLRPGTRFLIPILALAVVGVVTAVLANQQPPARTGSPPPAYPAFEGEPFTLKFPNPELLYNDPIAPAATQAEWTAVLAEDFEAGLNDFIWRSIDLDGPINGEYKWGTVVITNPLNPTSIRSAWAVGAGEDGGRLDVNSDGYPPNVMSWLVAGPFDLRDISAAVLSFTYALEADAGDVFGVGLSTDRVTFTGIQANNGGPGDWFNATYDISLYNGEPQVWIAFIFTSDSTANPAAKRGAFLDDVQLAVRPIVNVNLPVIMRQPTLTPTPTPTPTLTPTPTPTPPPSGNYVNEFTTNIDGWAVRRTSSGTSWELIHRGDFDAGRWGFLQLQVRSTNAYALTSPLFSGPQPPYTLEFAALFKDERDRHAYGAVFGGDWDGRPCPDNSFSACFNRYYELHVQYRTSTGGPYLEYRLRRIDGHNTQNQPIGPTLIDWTRAYTPADQWNVWKVIAEADGDIFILVNDRILARARDTTYLNNRYFGLEVATGLNNNARVKFDYFKIERNN